MADYTKEQLWKLYDKLPPDLKEAVFSADNADHIFDICRRNDLAAGVNPQLAKLAGDVLMGLLLPGDFQKTIEKELKLEKTMARKVAQEINRLIFFPVKESLNQLYQTETAPTEAIPAETAEKSSKPDTYREPVE